MKMANFLLFLSLFISLSSDIRSTFVDSSSIGVNYGRIANNLPDPSKVVQLLKSQGLTRVKIFDTEHSVLTALSGIFVTVAHPNELLSSAAANQSFIDTWVKPNILPFHPSTIFEAIAVGNEVFADPKNTTKFLVDQMKNVYASLSNLKINSSIKISSPFALSVLPNSYPSSSGSFKQE